MKTKKTKILITTIIILNLFISTLCSASAQNLIFTDITDHWAKEYIENIYFRGLARGYEDATFRPNNDITVMEVLVMITNVLEYNREQHNHLIDNYIYDLEANNIPLWAREYVAFTLENKILKVEELKELTDINAPTPTQINQRAKRHQVADYIARALIHHLAEEEPSIFVLPYIDAELIPNKSRANLFVLLSKGILDPTSNNGKFLPNDRITRAETAKLIAMLADLFDEKWQEDHEVEKQPEDQDTEQDSNDIVNEDTEQEPTQDKVPQETEQDDSKTENEQSENEEKEIETEIETAPEKKELQGTINNIIIANKNFLTILDNQNRESIYPIHSEVKIYIDEKEISISDIDRGMEVKLKIEKEEITKIHILEVQEDFKGYFVRFFQGTNTVLTLKDGKEALHVFVIPRETLIYIDWELKDLRDIALGDIVKIYKEPSGKIHKVHVERKLQNREGILIEKDSIKREIKIKDERGYIHIYTVSNDSEIIRDGKKSNFNDLKTDDKLKIELEYSKIKKITAQVEKSTIEGIIKSVLIGEQFSIRLETKNGEKLELIIEQDIPIKINNKTASIYDLRYEQRAIINKEGRHIVEIIIPEQFTSQRQIGTIFYIDKTQHILFVRINDKTEIAVEVKANTLYIGKNNENIYFKDIYVGDAIMFEGEIIKEIFYAERIIILK